MRWLLQSDRLLAFLRRLVIPLPTRLPQRFSRLRLTRFWGGTQTWKLSHWRFIKRDEKERKDTLYLYILSIPYNHLFVKREFSLCSPCFSKSTGLKYPKEECLRFRL